MTCRIIRPRDWRIQPWKNGGGVTHEVAREDDALGMRWRLSVADVVAEGPFSLFPGVDRVITLLTGQGFVLRFDDGREHAINSVSAPFGFAGEAALHCTLVDGPVRDFNLMTRRDAASAKVRVASLTPRAEALLCTTTRTVVFVVEGSLALEAGGEAWTLGLHDTALLSQNTTARWRAARDSATALLVELTERPHGD